MTSAYCRMVVRARGELVERLTTIAERLHNETRLEYPRAAIVRGLIALGLNKITDAPSLAVEFISMRVVREIEAESAQLLLPIIGFAKDRTGFKSKRKRSSRRRSKVERERGAIKHGIDHTNYFSNPHNDGSDMWSVFYRNRVIDPAATARWKAVVEKDRAERARWHAEQREVERALRAKEGRPPLDKPDKPDE